VGVCVLVWWSARVAEGLVLTHTPHVTAAAALPPASLRHFTHSCLPVRSKNNLTESSVEHHQHENPERVSYVALLC
jgi:hypothetical protein